MSNLIIIYIVFLKYICYKCYQNCYLPSYFEQDASNINFDSDIIKKPIWGREGHGIKVLDRNNNPLYNREIDNPEAVVQRNSSSYLYQEFVKQPVIRSIQTDEGFLNGYLTISCFMLGKSPSAVYARFSEEEIAGTEAYWIPLLIKK